MLAPGQFRPIAILSAWWRAWSSTWMRSEWVQAWSTRLFPASVAGGMPKAQGTTLADAGKARLDGISIHWVWHFPSNSGK